MAEGGVAAAMAHVDARDSWQVHFRDTMVGGKLLNNPRMAELHAQEAPDRVRELEAWGAVFDRTRDGRILQRPFGGHTYPRLAHVGDRTGLEMIRTLQDRAVAAGITVYMECTITHLLTRPDRVKGAFGYWRTTGRPVVFPAKAIVLATGGIGRAYQVTSNSWEYSGDGQALAYLAGAELIDMEFVQFHPTGMVWPPGVRGLLVTEAVRGEGGILRNKDGERFMWKYLPEDRRNEYAATDEEADALGRGPERRPDDRRPPAAGALDPRQRRPGDLHRGPRGPRLAPRRRLPRHQLPAGRPRPAQAAVDVRAVQGARRRRHHGRADGGRPDDPLHDGRHPGRRRDRRDDPRRAVRRRRGRRRDARREPARRQLAVGPARVRPADRGRRGRLRGEPDGRCRTSTRPRSRRRATELAAPFGETGGRRGEDPYRLHEELQAAMGTLVGIFRTEDGPRRGDRHGSRELRARWPRSGSRAVAPTTRAGASSTSSGTCSIVSEAIARSARQRRESRGAHSRIDFPEPDAKWARQNSVVRLAGDDDGGRDDAAAGAAGRAARS